MPRHLPSQLACLQATCRLRQVCQGLGGRQREGGQGAGSVGSSSVYLEVDADITVFGQARVLMEGPELFQGIQVPILEVLQSTNSLKTAFTI